MITRRIGFLKLLILTELLGPVLWAGDKLAKPEVTVQFRLKEPAYIQELKDTEIKTLETNLSSKSAAILQEHIGFLTFVTGAGPKYSLTLELDRKDPCAPGPYHEVGFSVRMKGPQIRHKGGYWAKFRDRLQYGKALGDLEGAISLKLAHLDDLTYERLVRDFLKQVPICGEGTKFLAQPLLRWVIPYTQTDLLMGWGSCLSIRNMLPADEGGPIGLPFRAEATKPFESPGDETYHERILCVAIPGDTDPNTLRRFRADEVSVTELYVVEYWRFDESLEGPETPDDASH